MEAKYTPLHYPLAAVPGNLRETELTKHNFLDPEYVLLFSSIKCADSNQVEEAHFSKGDLYQIW